MPDIIKQLLRSPQQFNLFQAISLLERAAPDRAPVGTGVGTDEAVRLAAHVDMAFAPSDIASIKPNSQPGPAYILRTPALTLAGGQGPLAAPFTELLLEQRSQRNSAGLDFLDIFNQRLIGFMHRARVKSHLALAPGQLEQAPLLRTIDMLSGLGRTQRARGPSGEQAWLRHAALQNAAPRSMTSLLALLRDRLKVQFTGEQFVGGWHALAPRDRARLGRAAGRTLDSGIGSSVGSSTGSRVGSSNGSSTGSGIDSSMGLGLGASLGARAWDQAAGMALSAPPLAPATFAALLPGSPRFALLGWLVARHLQADFTVTLTLRLAVPPATRLGAGRLGHSAWLCRRPSPASAASAAKYQPVRCLLSTERLHPTKR